MGSAALRALTGLALLSLPIQPALSSPSHRHLHLQQRSENHTDNDESGLVKKRKLTNRAGQCAFPEVEGLVAVTPDYSNAGWAMSPDQECTAGSYCPFACPSGQLMNQWKPGTTYIYPESMDGGLFCDETGIINKPFPEEEYCVDGVGNVEAINNCGQTVAFCQTVLPGNENMLIPTAVEASATLAVPGTSYWDATAAHYYVNPPGYTTEEACAWGTEAQPIGNWAPYVAGTNQDSTGYTYVKLGWNPIYTNSYSDVNPTFGLEIVCTGDCVGLPCSIDPSVHGFGGVSSPETATGAGGADFCVVTVTSGSASIVVFSVDGSAEVDSSNPAPSEQTAKATAAAPVKQLSSTVAAILGLGPASSANPAPKATTIKPSPGTIGASITTTTTHPAQTTASRVGSGSRLESTYSSSVATTSQRASSLSSSSLFPPNSTISTASSTISSTVFVYNTTSINATAYYTDLSPTATVSNSLAETTTTRGVSVPTNSQISAADVSRPNQSAIVGLVAAIVAAACLY
ncbi:hypothetical protein BD289DRAFT_445543 [Coniella lustricola]|uniref:SUN domain-containing protein n=1 Tax=Coniella lustricola TaxID=2025994 RepID=A0A2T2ZUS8_9PEZI|nr:hypothetical protein BD289DRAFT_445543 [Coniella lustricola]